MSSRVVFKSIIRQQTRRNRLCTYLQRLSIFCSCVILVSTLKYFSVGRTHSNTCFNCQLNKQVDITHPTNVSSNTNDSIEETLMVAGIRFQKNKCLVDHLLTLPKYASEFCENYSENCTNLSCLNVLTGSNIDQYEPVIKLIPPKSSSKSEETYFNLTKHCDQYKQDAGYTLNALDEDSKNFPIAFNILIHTGISQFELLLKTLYRPQNSFCIHIDIKATSNFKEAVNNIIGCFDNIHLASKLESIKWAGYNRLQADITCMKDQLSRDIKWKYLINTAGQAFPLRTVEEMVKILKIYNGANDIEGIYGNRLLKSRFENEWIESETEITKTGKLNPKPPHDIDIVRGSAYGIFSRNFVDFIINDQRAIDLLHWSRTTWSPDEIYWATLHHTYSNPHLKTPGGFSGYPSQKEWLAVYANWGEKPCHGRMVRGVCVNGVRNINSLIKRNEFFVNKFYEDLQPLALSCLSAWINFKQECGAPFNDNFYRKLNFTIKPR